MFMVSVPPFVLRSLGRLLSTTFCAQAPDLAVIDTDRSNRPSPQLRKLLEMVRDGAFLSRDREMTHGLRTENFAGEEEVGLQ